MIQAMTFQVAAATQLYPFVQALAPQLMHSHVGAEDGHLFAACSSILRCFDANRLDGGVEHSGVSRSPRSAVAPWLHLQDRTVLVDGESGVAQSPLNPVTAVLLGTSTSSCNSLADALWCKLSQARASDELPILDSIKPEVARV